MTHTEDLIHRLRDTASRGVSSWGDLQQEAADELERMRDAVADKEALAQPPLPVQEPRNFCPRCGKRTADLTTIHTCTPPQEKNNG